LVLLTSGHARATPYDISINTGTISVSTVDLALDFIGLGSPPNTATVNMFATDGVVNNSSNTGAVTGSIPGPITFDNSGGNFFNEMLINISSSSHIDFQLQLTSTPPTSIIPDSFTALLLDPSSGLPLFPTSDPTGSDSLFQVDIDGSADGSVSVFSPDVAVTLSQETAMPEPASVVLFGGSLFAFGLFYRRTPRW
jgi:hypothetical protein